MNILNWFKKEYFPPNASGICERPGYSADKRNVCSKELLVGAAPIVWYEKSPDDFRSYWNGQYTQNGGSDCYAWLLSMLVENANEREEGKRIKFSAKDIYGNCCEPYPVLGLYVEKTMKWLYHNGVTLEHLLPSNNLSEAQVRDLSNLKPGDRQVALVYKPNGFAYLAPTFTFDDIAQILQTGQFLGVSVILTDEGWTNKNGWVEPPLPNTPQSQLGYHAVALKEYGLVAGKKTISFEHAWGNWGYKGKGIGFFQENYLPYMFIPPQYLLDLPNNWRDTATNTTEKPKWQWNYDLYYGMEDQEDIKMLQKALKYEGVFPLSVPETGNFYGITYSAVMDFQEKYRDEILTPLGLTKPTGFVGTSTRKKLNEIFK
ncbi:MAG: peptidoglycan-binding domain-containing protein [Elusimicrobia bacterium]|nr:peptidoglycan-binding domain-containing protein [Elusimicrobiota bacterium]